jgi:DNA-binding MarR family transcriptional regulator
MDPADRRRTLVWLTDGGRAALDRENRVLDQLLLTTALDGMPPADVGLLLDALRSLLAHASTPALRKGHRHD